METEFGVRLMYSNAEEVPRDPVMFWGIVRSVQGHDPIRLLAVINNALLVHGFTDLELHHQLEAEFASQHVRDVLAAHRTKMDGDVFLFNRPSILLAMKLLMAVVRPDHEDEPLSTIGDITLHANDFVESPETMWDGDPGLIGLLAEFAPIWELINPRNIFHLFVRAFVIVGEHLAAHQRMRELLTASPFRAAPPDLLIDGLRLDDYLALVFGMYTHARDALLKQKTCIIDVEQFFNVTTLPAEGIRSFLERRSGTIATFRSDLSLELREVESFTAAVENGGVAMDVMTIKQRPIFVGADSRHTILDYRFLIELASTTLYWSIFDALDKKGRDLFSIFWGECFESYVVSELRFFYPPAAQLLSTDVKFDGGAVDALLDYGDFALAFEIKSGLLAKNPRLMRDPEALGQEIEKKFVEPKGIGQLVKAAKAIVTGEIETIRRDCRVYPVLVGDDPILQCFAANTYLDERFQKLYADRPANVAPVTVMLIDELEELLPYISTGVFDWRQVLDARFTANGVEPDPLHNTLSSLRAKKKIAHQANEFLSREGARIKQLILERYQFDKMPKD
jgi:hypothetical protein